MAGRIKNILDNGSAFYIITGSFGKSIRFAFSGNNNKLFSIKLQNGKNVILRKSTTDKDVFLTVFFSKYHRSPIHLGNSPVIIDLGCNIGLTLIDFLQEYPDAKITGVEMDPENFAIAKINTKQFPDVTLIQKAVWKSEGTVQYDGPDSQSYSVSNSSEKKFNTESITMNGILNQVPGGKADYLKMDIEGSEYAILLESNDTGWLKKIKYLSVEIHNTNEYDSESGLKKIINVLEKNSFIAWRSTTHWSSVFAINKEMI